MTDPYYTDPTVTIHAGDCLDVLATLPDASVDAVVTDPPYGLEFMGKEWDAPWKAGADVHADARVRRAAEVTPTGQAHSTSTGPYLAAGVNKYAAGLPFQQWCQLWATECLRVLKPGGHLLAFGGTRTSHRLACAIEDAGFEIRDSIAWLYGSGFPKSLDVSKAIDKAAGARHRLDAIAARARGDHAAERRALDALALVEREVIGIRPRPDGTHRDPTSGGAPSSVLAIDGRLNTNGAMSDITAPNTPDAERWQGWGTALKPAHEPIVVARKPLAGTVAANVLAHGTGALNVDGCRVGATDAREGRTRHGGGIPGNGSSFELPDSNGAMPAGRWPSNVVLDESQAAALDQQSGELATQATRTSSGTGDPSARGVFGVTAAPHNQSLLGDTGGASRFFFIAREDQPCSMQSATSAASADQATTTKSSNGGSHATAPAPTVPIDALGSRFTYTAKAGASERVRLPKVGAGNGRVTGLGGKVRQCNVCETRAIESGAGEPSCGHGDYRWEEPTADKLDTIAHPTVKPLSLMRWLVRLVTPPGGTVLEPFAGSGTTVEACILEGFRCIAIEREADYLPLIRQRIHRRRDPVAAVRATGEDAGLFDLLGGDA